MITPNPNERLIGLPQATAEQEAAKWFTRPGLAAALKVSVCTVDRMVANGELPCVRLGRRVRFYLPDVVEALRKGNRKFGRRAAMPGKTTTDGRGCTQIGGGL
ncbi:MAG TPA: excisionase family DNA-binding protein [Candidatus Paceibacterota bacterium]|nr:excisionase family DNA-binding protein [Verrucomicrobiota bacterium]HSA13023.1 excisionase family DNA-binding protein [Candidatus Paceibacterota bacterium]